MAGRLPCLTVRQPWASLIVGGWKDVENRTWRTPHRGLLVVHAGLTHDPDGDPWARRAGLQIEGLPAGAALGVTQIVDVVRGHPSVWAMPGCWHWLLAEPRAFPAPVPLRGRMALFEAPTAVAEAVRRVAGTRTTGS